MTNEAYVFQQDVKERSKMKTGARHKKSGCKSKKCTLPSDHLTPAQRKKMNGEVETMNLNTPMKLTELRKYSVSLQNEYLQNCITKYHARRTDMLRMLHTNSYNLDSYLKNQGISLIFPPSVKGHMAKPHEKWLEFIGKEESLQKVEPKILEDIFGIPVAPIEEVVEEPIVEIKAEPIKEVEEEKAVVESETEPVVVKQPNGYSSVLKMKLDLKGTKEEILFMMNAILGEDCNYIVNLNIVNADKEVNA